MLPTDMPQVKAVRAISQTHIHPLPFVQGAYLLCTSDDYEQGKLFIVKYGMLSDFALWQISKP